MPHKVSFAELTRALKGPLARCNVPFMQFVDASERPDTLVLITAPANFFNHSNGAKILDSVSRFCGAVCLAGDEFCMRVLVT